MEPSASHRGPERKLLFGSPSIMNPPFAASYVCVCVCLCLCVKDLGRIWRSGQTLDSFWLSNVMSEQKLRAIGSFAGPK